MADSVDEVFAALANPTRRALLSLLADGPQPVQDLADHFPVSRPSISGHLKVLRDAGLVSEDKQGRQRYYRLEPAPLRDASEWLSPYERFWRQRLSSLRELVEDRPEDPSEPPGDEADG